MNLTPATNGIARAATALLDARLTATALGCSLEDTATPEVVDQLGILHAAMETIRVALGEATACHELYRHADGPAVGRLREITDFLRRAE